VIPNTLLLLHDGATAIMTGLIWFVQVVHYPLMARIGEAEFGPYALEHQRRTTLVVAPVMVTEAAASIWLAALMPGPLTILGAVLIAVLWASTFLVQVPLHGRLAARRSERELHRLVAGNWVRTAAWSARLAIALTLLNGTAA
jgi:hypothetical protein